MGDKRYRLDWSFFCHGLPMSGDTIPSGKALGGSETACIQIAETLARQGHRPIVFCNAQEQQGQNGVQYLPIGWVQQKNGSSFPKGFFDYVRSTPHDVLVVMRLPGILQWEFKSKVNFLWQHDLATKTGPSNFHMTCWNIDRILLPSAFMKAQYQEVHGGPDALYHVTRNGIDLGLIDSVPEQERDRFKVMFTSRPERGLDIMLREVFPRILKREPKATLHISRYDDVATLPLYQECARMAQQFGDRVVNLGNLGKADLYKHYKQARVYAYSSVFEEISCCVGDTFIDMPRDYRKYPDGVPIRELVGKSGFPVYCYDEKLGRIALQTVKWVAKTRRNAEIWKLTLDDGTALRATPDHKIMLRDGSYRELRELKSGDSLMPLYKHLTVTVNLNNGCWENEHRLVGEWQAGRKLDSHNEHVHHKNGWWSNAPDNLQVLSRSEHFSITHKGKKRGVLERHKQSENMIRRLAAMSDEERATYFESRPKAVRTFWVMFRQWTPEQQREYLKKRTEARRKKFNGGWLAKKWWDETFAKWPREKQQEWLQNRTRKIREATDKNPENAKIVAESNRRFWRNLRAKPKEEQEAYRQWRRQRLREGWAAKSKELSSSLNHTVIKVEPDGYEDVYDMEVETHHNFVANGIVIHNCITLNEFGACGGVFVGPWKAALPETAGGAGILIRDDGSIGRIGDPLDKGLGPVSAKFCDRMADEVVDLIHNDERWETLSKAGRKRAEKWTWDEVAEDWTQLAHELIGQRTSEPKRVAKHFLVNSDVVAAKRYADHLNDDRLRKSVNHYIDRFVPFMSIEDEAERKAAIAQFYEERSGGEQADWRTAFWADTEPRTRVLIDWIAQHKDEVGSVLDFGCAHGGYARALSNAFSSLRVLGADVSPTLIRCAKELRVAKMPDGSPACLYPDNLSFVIGDEDTDILDTHDGLREGVDSPRQFDLVVAMEVLEHLPNAEEVAKKLERHCKPGGWMCFTVPHGHRERDEFVTKGVMPVHVRSFDKHDLMDMFGNRDGFHVVAFSDFKELDYDRTFAGWFMVFYRNDGKPLGEIDWERKFFLQGPRGTLSVCMITNNCEATLHRALKSIHKIADQIIVVDNGPSQDSTVEIAKRYTDDVRLGTSPFWCYAHKMRHPQDQILPGVCDIAGFETPRNESTQGAWGDWIFWIDSDENLLNWQHVWQYLRPNSYLGYAVNQHHLSVDPPGSLKKDIPVRLFRNHQGMRFYGCMTPQTKVVTNPGLEEIKEVQIGTLVRTHDGTYRPVTKLWKYEVKDEMVRVLARGMPEPLELTRDHKVYAIKHEQCFYNYGKHYLCKPTCEKRCPHKFYEHYSPDWIMAKDLRPGDILMYPVEKTTSEIDHVRLSDHAAQGRLIGKGSAPSWKLADGKWNRTIRSHTAIANDRIDLNGTLLRLCGYYVSDGHVAEGAKLIISFAEHEQSHADDVSEIAKGLGFNYSEIHKDHMITAKVYGRPLCEWLKGEFGFGARNKKAPLWLMRLPIEKQKEFLRGLWRGDGNVSGTLLRYTTSSVVLAHQVQDLLLRQKIMANIRYGKASKSYEVFARLQATKFLDWPMPNIGRMRTRQTWTDGDYVYMPIRNIERFEYQGPIFDLTVEGNHSFVANRVAVSNCVHEHAELAINAGVGPHVVVLPLDIHHDGYLTEPIRRGRFARNIKLLECDRLKYPDRMLGIYLYDVRDNIHMARYQMERNGGVVDEQVQRYAWHAIETFRKHFLGKDVMLAQDGINYYSDALHLLGIGVEMAIDLDVRREGAYLNGGVQRFRVADYDEAKLVTDQLLRQRFGPFEGRYVS